MTDDELRARRTSLADAALARRADLADAARPPLTAADRLDAPFHAGDRILDLRVGREGTVQHVGAPDRTGSFLLDVAFDDGSGGMRVPSDLILRPRLPSGRS